MKTVESTRVVYDDIVKCVESDDGEYRINVNDKPGSPAHEQALERIRKYEESARGAIWGRLIAKGAVRSVGYGLGCMCRSVLGDDGDFYLFAPKDEDDCREFVTWAKILGCDVFARPNDYVDVMERLNTPLVMAGERYVVQVTDSEWIYLYPVDGRQDTLAERMARVQDKILAEFDGEKEADE